jgi:hypothetical protein
MALTGQTIKFIFEARRGLAFILDWITLLALHNYLSMILSIWLWLVEPEFAPYIYIMLGMFIFNFVCLFPMFYSNMYPVHWVFQATQLLVTTGGLCKMIHYYINFKESLSMREVFVVILITIVRQVFYFGMMCGAIASIKRTKKAVDATLDMIYTGGGWRFVN